MKAFPHLGLAGLLSIFPLGTSQSDSRILEQEMKEVAELAIFSSSEGINRGSF